MVQNQHLKRQRDLPNTQKNLGTKPIQNRVNLQLHWISTPRHHVVFSSFYQSCPAVVFCVVVRLKSLSLYISTSEKLKTRPDFWIRPMLLKARRTQYEFMYRKYFLMFFTLIQKLRLRSRFSISWIMNLNLYRWTNNVGYLILNKQQLTTTDTVERFDTKILYGSRWLFIFVLCPARIPFFL